MYLSVMSMNLSNVNPSFSSPPGDRSSLTKIAWKVVLCLALDGTFKKGTVTRVTTLAMMQPHDI